METVTDADSPQYATLLTGHFRKDGAYRTQRKRGTRDYLLMQTLGGHGYVKHAGGTAVTKAGDFVLLLPGTPHDYGTQGEQWELRWAHFLPHPHWLALLRWPSVSPLSPGVMLLTVSDPLLLQNAGQSLRETHRLATGAGRMRDLFAMNALEKTLLWCASALPRPSTLDPRVQTAMDYLSQHMAELVTLEDAAKTVQLSPSRLAHLFSQGTGQTPGQFLEARRMERAGQLLARTGLTVQSVAADVGYDNPFYFSLRFKKATGQSPTEFRRRTQDENLERDKER